MTAPSARPLSFPEVIDRSPEELQILVRDAESRLEACGIPRATLGRNFVRYWLLHGMSPAQIVEIACGREYRYQQFRRARGYADE